MTQFAFHSREAQGALNRNGRSGSNYWPVLIFDAHNAVWTILGRMGKNAPWYLRPVLGLEAQRVRRYEGLIVRNFDQTLAVTEVDRRALSAAATSSLNATASTMPAISVIPIAVDTGRLQPVRRQPGSTNILTLGTLHYPPNADGIRWFLNEVFPLIQGKVPGATLTIIGKNPPEDFLDRASHEPHSIYVTGYVPDLTPYLEKAALMAVPVRAGGGMRVRILEAFARAMPVVTTTIGLEGINAQADEEVLVADSPSDFASTVVCLLRDENLQAKLATKGHRLAENNYDWKVVLKAMDTIYNEI
jgi:glycosyltransferase involved in cell wall biosynthesis